MGKKMKLIKVINRLDDFDEESTIYLSRPWGLSSLATVEYEPEDGSLPHEAGQLGLVYFLEIFIAKEFLEGWLSNSKQKSDDDICRRLIDYAKNDA